MVLTLTAALPSASNVSLLAERYGADNGRIARIIMASTVLAFVTFSADGVAVRGRRPARLTPAPDRGILSAASALGTRLRPRPRSESSPHEAHSRTAR
jgi:hypothetical protein